MIETLFNQPYPSVEVDEIVGATYIKLSDDEVVESIPFDYGRIQIDMNANGQPVGIEILERHT